MSEWKTIDSAPKDGSLILAVRAGFVPSIVMWIEINGNGLLTIDPEHFVEDYHFEEYIESTRYDPTHWMPLPKSPKDS